MEKKRLVIGITAHVDSGKTTLSEALLYHSGEIRTMGRVDHKNAFLDTHPMERDRGITIFSHQAIIHWNDQEFTLLDTPGHVDFSAETERTMQILDYAILVVSGTNGVQSHTETLWRLLRRYHVPVFLFVNKMDLAGADKTQRMAELQERLGEMCIDFSRKADADFFESIALLEEAWAEEYLAQENISQQTIAQGIADGKLVPCYFGSALKSQGISEFLTGLSAYTLAKPDTPDFGAQVFKIATDEKNNRLTHLKVTGGKLQVRDAISYTAPNGTMLTEKINQIRIYAGAKYQTIDMADAGTVCTVTGLSQTFAGQGLGAAKNSAPPALAPVMRYAVQLPKNVNPADAMKQLMQLEEEDPTLHLVWQENAQEIHIQPMGEIQLEILQKLIAERFGYDVTFDAGQISYLETIADTVEGVGHYEPLCHYAEVHLKLEPLPAGSGLVFAADCREELLDKNWQRLVLTHLQEKTHVGVLTGSPITDMKITLCAGKAHLKHTEGGDFRQATYRAVRNGLRKAKSILLEPWYDFTMELPTESVGRAMTDLQQLHGEFGVPETIGETAVISGSAPVAGLRHYHKILSGYTHGKGRLNCTSKGYAPCQNTEEILAAIGYDCNADIENTADSIFCAHGAGFLVKWNEVEDHMHLPSCLEKSAAVTAAEPAALHFSRGSSGDIFAQDKELMAIFERTYGKINRDSRHALYTPKEDAPVCRDVTAAITGEEYVLVDGYNIIFAWEELKKLAQESLDAARSRLIHVLCNYCGYRQCHLILVFDAYKVKGQHREIERYCNIDIVYTKESETADSYIEKTAHDLGKQHRVRVATSDGMEQMIILGSGALRVTADEFYREVTEAEQAIRTYAQSMTQGKKQIRKK